MKSIQHIIQNIRHSLFRFPIPVLAGVLAFIFFVTEIHFVKSGSVNSQSYLFLKLALEAVSGIALFTAFDIFSETKHVQLSKRLGLYLLGFCVLGMHFYTITPGMFDSESIFVTRYLLYIVCYHLLVSCVAFYSNSEINAFWQYNYFLFLRILTSLLYSLTLFAGLASALFALDKLIEINISSKYYVDLFAFIFLILNTILFLMGFPKSFEEFKVSIDFKKSIRIFVQYILIPIVTLYIVILYFYMFKIILSMQMPNGWVCIPILIFAIAGILSYLLTYPIRLDPQFKSIFVYSKYFFYILLPLLSLYFVAIIKRIKPYGITEDRYLVVVLGLWLLVISLYIIISKRDNIIVIPVSLFILMFLSALGPWGMFQLSTQNQLARLERLLKRNHLLEGNKLVTKSSQQKTDKNDAKSIRSILFFLNKRGEIQRIHKWLDDEDQAKMKKAIDNNEFYVINAIFTNLEADTKSEIRKRYTFTSDDFFVSKRPISFNEFRYLVEFNSDNAEDASKFNVRLLDSNLYVYRAKDTFLTYNLTSKMHSLFDHYKTQDSISKIEPDFESQFELLSNENIEFLQPADSLIIQNTKARLYINSLELFKSDSTLIPTRIIGYLTY